MRTIFSYLTDVPLDGDEEEDGGDQQSSAQHCDGHRHTGRDAEDATVTSARNVGMDRSSKDRLAYEVSAKPQSLES
ncbi:MAG: hypothetical protein AAF202_10400 [Pseudomonadota bacterium]